LCEYGLITNYDNIKREKRKGIYVNAVFKCGVGFENPNNCCQNFVYYYDKPVFNNLPKEEQFRLRRIANNKYNKNNEEGR